MTGDTPGQDGGSRAGHSRSDEGPPDPGELNPFDSFSKRILDGLTRTDRELRSHAELRGLRRGVSTPLAMVVVFLSISAMSHACGGAVFGTRGVVNAFLAAGTVAVTLPSLGAWLNRSAIEPAERIHAEVQTALGAGLLVAGFSLQLVAPFFGIVSWTPVVLPVGCGGAVGGGVVSIVVVILVHNHLTSDIDETEPQPDSEQAHADAGDTGDVDTAGEDAATTGEHTDGDDPDATNADAGPVGSGAPAARDSDETRPGETPPTESPSEAAEQTEE